MSRTVNSGIINLLKKKILSGGFDNVTFLPSERKLAEEYQVGRGIIRGALRILKDEGIIYNVPQRGFRIHKRNERRRLKRVILRMEQVSAKAYEAMGLVAGICAGANEIFAEVIISTPPAMLDLKELQERFNAGDIQGIIFLETSFNLSFQEVINAGIPCVVANIESDDALPSVRMDYRGIGRTAGERLLQAGYTRPAVYSGTQSRFIYREMIAGFRGAAAEEGITLDNSAIVCGGIGETPEELEKLFALPADKRPDAFFAARDYRAKDIYRLCAKYSLRVPEDVGIISYDNISWPDAESSGLTSVTEEVNEIGRQAVFLLQQQFESGYAPVTCVIPGNIVERKSLKSSAKKQKLIYHHKG